MREAQYIHLLGPSCIMKSLSIRETAALAVPIYSEPAAKVELSLT